MITIKEITKSSDIKKYVDFPNKLYKDNKYYIPCFFDDELKMLNKKKNPAYQYCETKLFLAYKDNNIVGRICGLINHAYNEKKNLKQIRFCRLDVIDDIEVTKQLINKVISWGLERGLTQLVGPIGFSDLDKQGMLVEGFDEDSNSITLYNHPYYMQHLETLGFTKDADWVEYQVICPQEMNERINKIANLITRRYGYKVLKLKNKKELKPYVHKAFAIYNEAFEPLYGVVPLNAEQIDDTVKQFVSLVNFEYLYLVTNKDEELIGFGLLIPSLNKPLKKWNGRLFPFGFFGILKALKTYDVLDMYLVAVKPAYQNLGVNALILCEGIKSGIKNGVKVAETGPELENNEQVKSLWKDFDTRQHRRRRCYIRELK